MTIDVFGCLTRHSSQPGFLRSKFKMAPRSGKKPKKFRPCLTPRYLPGFAQKTFAEMDLKNYNRHLKRMFYMKCVVDATPPYLHPYNYLNAQKCEADTLRLIEIEKENKQLLCKINMINRTRGDVDCWNKFRPSRGTWMRKVEDLQRIIKENKQIYKRICCVESNYKRSDHEKHFEHFKHVVSMQSKLPFTINDRKTEDEIVKEQPSISGNLGKHFPRPKVYMDFKFKDGRCLGEIIIELYAEYAPKAVLNFISLCKSNAEYTYRHCRIHFARKCKFIELGMVTGGGGKSIYSEDFEEEPVLMHCAKGVVSMVPTNEHKFNSIFTITMSPMPEFDKKYLAIGKVVKGNDVLSKINDMCKRVGTPLEPIVVTRCGEIPIPKSEFGKFSNLEDYFENIDECNKYFENVA